MNKSVRACSILPLMVVVTATAHAEADWGDKLSSMVTGGKASVDFRYRYEYVDEDGIDKDAKASTLRSRLTLASALKILNLSRYTTILSEFKPPAVI